MVKNFNTTYAVIITIFTLVIIGLIMLSSASVVQSFELKGNNYYYLIRQLSVGVVPGLIVLGIASLIDYRNWRKFATPLLFITIALLLAVFIPGIGLKVGGATRWIDLGPISLQPTEIIKLTFLLYLTTWLEKREAGIKDMQTGFLPFITIIGFIGFLIMLQPDLGTMSVIMFTAIVVYYVAGARLSHLGLIGISAVVLLVILIKAAPYRLARFTVFLNPELDPQGIGYQINQALLAIGSGGFWGRGLGKSVQKYNYLPEPTGDSIFAVMAEELGFIRITIIVLLYAGFAITGFYVAKNANDNYGKMLAAGITAWLSFQALVNIGAMLALVPLTGIPLPFVSYGGTAMLMSLAAIGILINISKQSS